MSPYPTRIVREDLLDHAKALLEAEGLEGLTLGKLASQLGVKPASLYNHFESKAELLRAINESTMRQLVGMMRDAANRTEHVPALDKLRAMAAAYRDYARTHPICYGLVFTNTLLDVRLDPILAEQLALPLQAVIAELVGADESLNGLRGAWALLHGFVMLELGGHFRRAGDLEDAYNKAIDWYLGGLGMPH